MGGLTWVRHLLCNAAPSQQRKSPDQQKQAYLLLGLPEWLFRGCCAVRALREAKFEVSNVVERALKDKGRRVAAERHAGAPTIDRAGARQQT